MPDTLAPAVTDVVELTRALVRCESVTPREAGALELLERALPIWLEMLRPGGALGLAWNTRVARRDRVVALLDRTGFSVCASDAYLGFEHSVDQAILRDLVVATKAPR